VIGKRTEVTLLLFDEAQGKSAVKSYRVKAPDGEPSEAVAAFAVPTKAGRYSARIILQNAETGAAARGSASIDFAEPVPAAVWLDPPLLLQEAAGWADLGAAADSTLSAVYGYDAAKFAPLLGPLGPGPRRVTAAVRLALGVPQMELQIAAVDDLDGTKTDIPVTVLGTRQEKSTRWYVVELAFGGLKPGTHELTMVARDTSGAPLNASKTAFTVK
jgi:head-tail adaptor